MLKSTITAVAALTLTLVAAAPATADSGWAAVATHYEQIRQALVSDSLAGVAEPAAALREEIEVVRRDLTAARAGVPADSLEELAGLLPEAAAAAQAVETAADLEAARDAFYALTKLLVRWRQAAGSGPAVAYCSMKKRSWLQPAGEAMGNPYLGKEMAGCGEIVGGA
jgi:Protein of unknown function (DUF3347)